MSASRVHEVFAQALSRRPETVEAFLDAACSGEPEVRAVASLLGARRAASGFLERPVPAREELATLVQSPFRLAPGDSFDGFEIVRTLGEGGSGVVYEAQSRAPNRRVAIKVLRFGSQPRAEVDGLEAEATVLARLQHPSVAQVYAVGRIHGRTYVVMELLEDALPLTRYVRARGLPTRERLALWAAVCDGVHHGHQRRVLHNDLKPANVLVAADGRPKIIDFGIARGLEPGTRSDLQRRLAGTLPYMSPEALATGACEVDVRSDVYALGVLGYEVLVGEVPLDPGSRTAAEAAPWLRERIATPPSLRGSPLRGDLAAIVHKALAFAPDARYASASALAADVRRHLDRRPVEARGGGALYHVGCLARRHRAAFAATVLLVLVSVVAALVAGSLAIEKDREGRVARAERARADFQSYVANVAAAGSALTVHDVAEARTRLEQAPPRFRGWEWRHLASRLDASERTLAAEVSAEVGATSPDGELLIAAQGVWLARSQRFLHRVSFPRGGIVSAAFVPRGGPLVLGNVHGSVMLVEPRHGAVLSLQHPHQGKVWAIACAPDGECFATGGVDGRIVLWDVAGRPRRTIEVPAPRVYSLAFDPRGSVLWSGGDDGVVRGWDAATGAAAASFAAHEANVEGLAVRPDGGAIATVSIDGRVSLWDLATRQAVWTRSGHTSGIKAVAFSPDGGLVATASVDRTARLWRASDGGEIACLVGHTGLVRSVAFSPDGGRLLTFSRDGTVKTWVVGAFEAVPALRGHRNTVCGLRFAEDGRALVSASEDGEIRRWATPGGESETILSEPSNGVVHALDVRDREVYALTRNELRVLPLEGGDVRRSWAVRGACLSVGPGPSGTRVYVGANRRIDVFDAERALLLHVWPAHEGHVQSLATTASGDRLASSDGRTLLVRRTGTDAPPAVLAVEHGPVTALAFDPSGRRLAAAEANGIVVFDVGTARAVGHLDSPGGRVQVVAYSPDGQRVAAASEDGAVRIWDAETGMQLLVLRGHRIYATSLAWSPDGSVLASGGGNAGPETCLIRLWRAGK